MPRHFVRKHKRSTKERARKKGRISERMHNAHALTRACRKKRLIYIIDFRSPLILIVVCVFFVPFVVVAPIRTLTLNQKRSRT